GNSPDSGRQPGCGEDAAAPRTAGDPTEAGWLSAKGAREPEGNIMEHRENCKEVFALLSEYLDLELPPTACQEIEHHLEGCSPGVELAESLRKPVPLCRSSEPSLMPEPLSAAARAELETAWRKVLATREPAK